MTAAVSSIEDLRATVRHPQRFLSALDGISNDVLKEELFLTKVDQDMYPTSVKGTIIDECIHHGDLMNELLTYDIPVTAFTVCRFLISARYPWGREHPRSEYWAAETDEEMWRMAKRLIEKTGMQPETIVDQFNHDVLGSAVYGGNLVAVRELLKNPNTHKFMEAKMHRYDNEETGFFALGHALDHGDSRIARTLIKAGSPRCYGRESKEHLHRLREILDARERGIENTIVLSRLIKNDNVLQLAGEYAIPCDVPLDAVLLPPDGYARFFGDLPPADAQGGALAPGNAILHAYRNGGLPPAYMGRDESVEARMARMSPQEIRAIIEALLEMN